MQHCDCGRVSGGGKRSSGGRSAVDEVAGGDGGGVEGEKGMRNRPVKLNPKLTVLLYVLTRRGGLDRIARHRRFPMSLSSLRVIPPIPPTRRRSRVTRWRWNSRRGFGKRGTSASTSAGTTCELQQKAAAPNYFRPQATTVDNLITVAIPVATWPFSAYVVARQHVDPKMRPGPFVLPSSWCAPRDGRRDFESLFLPPATK